MSIVFFLNQNNPVKIINIKNISGMIVYILNQKKSATQR